MERKGWREGLRPPVLGVGVGPCWVGVGVPAAGEAAGAPWKVGVGGTPLEVAKRLWVALGLGLGEVGG